MRSMVSRRERTTSLMMLHRQTLGSMLGVFMSIGVWEYSQSSNAEDGGQSKLLAFRCS